MLAIRTVFFNVLTQLFGHLGVAFKQIFTCHAGFTCSTTRRNDIFRTLQRLGRRRRIREIHPLQSAVTHLFIDSLQSRLIHILQTNVRSQFHHRSRLCHIGTDHPAGTDNRQFFVR